MKIIYIGKFSLDYGYQLHDGSECLETFYDKNRKRAYDKTYRYLKKIKVEYKKNILNMIKWCDENLQKTPNGWYAYKTFGNTPYLSEMWFPLKKEKILIENDLCRFTQQECGSGVNVGTFEYVKRNYAAIYGRRFWRVFISKRDMLRGDVIVPDNTDGKIRCRRVKLVNDVTHKF